MDRCIYIFGADFCGSTLLDRLFGSIPDVAAPGELHWLVDAPRRQSIPTRAGWPVQRACMVHNYNCPVLGPDFVQTNFNPDSLYPVVADRLEVSTLISSDKSWEHYRRFGLYHSVQFVVLFKSPIAQVASFKKNEKRLIHWSLDFWTRLYGRAAPSNATLVSYERLADNPNGTMKRLCSWLGLPTWTKIDPETFLIQTDQAYHHIGGNPGARKPLPIRQDMGWLQILDPLDRQQIVDHKESRCLHDKLLAQAI